jgi:hypothetical protein
MDLPPAVNTETAVEAAPPLVALTFERPDDVRLRVSITARVADLRRLVDLLKPTPAEGTVIRDLRTAVVRTLDQFNQIREGGAR